MFFLLLSKKILEFDLLALRRRAVCLQSLSTIITELIMLKCLKHLEHDRRHRKTNSVGQYEIRTNVN